MPSAILPLRCKHSWCVYLCIYIFTRMYQALNSVHKYTEHTRHSKRYSSNAQNSLADSKDKTNKSGKKENRSSQHSNLFGMDPVRQQRDRVLCLKKRADTRAGPPLPAPIYRAYRPLQSLSSTIVGLIHEYLQTIHRTQCIQSFWLWSTDLKGND